MGDEIYTENWKLTRERTSQSFETLFEEAGSGVLEAEPIISSPEVDEVVLIEKPTEKDDAHIDLQAIAKAVPEKMAFKIGEVAEIAAVKPYVLRYWESEFDALNPQKSAFNQRMYSKRDVETVLLIKKLLYDEKFSIAGAKKKIRELRKELKVEKTKLQVIGKLDEAIGELEELKTDIEGLRQSLSFP